MRRYCPPLRRRLWATAAAFGSFAAVGGCAPGVSGRLLDGNSYTPVADAEVILQYTGWGHRDGQLVWDAAKHEAVRSGADGRFRLTTSGGTRLIVRGRGFDEVATEICPAPAPVYIGGPYPKVSIDKTLLVPMPGSPAGSPLAKKRGGSALASEIGLAVETPEQRDGEWRFVFSALPGHQLAFVRGTGRIPRPRAESWTDKLALDGAGDCGWLLVRASGAPTAAIRIGSAISSRSPEGQRAFTFLFAPLAPSPDMTDRKRGWH